MLFVYGKFCLYNFSGSTYQANPESTNEDDDEQDDDERPDENERSATDDGSGFIVRAVIDEQGALLVVPEVGVSMSVPEGAIPRGRRHNLHLAVLGENSFRPNLPPGLTLLSAVVVCGPAGIDLVKPVILQFEHCAELRTGNWELSLWSADIDLETRSNNSTSSSVNSGSPAVTAWRKVLMLGGDPTNLPGQPFAQLDHAGVFLVTETPSVYAVAGENSVVAPGLAVKRLCMAVFVSRDRDHIRCHILEDTKASFKLVSEQVSLKYKFKSEMNIYKYNSFVYFIPRIAYNSCAGTSLGWHSYRSRYVWISRQRHFASRRS